MNTFSVAVYRAFLALSLIAVVLRALVPVGYMPDMQSAAGFEMVLCGINGPQTVTVDASFAPEQEDKPSHDTAQNKCVFALLQSHVDLAFGQNDADVVARSVLPAHYMAAAHDLHGVFRVLPPFAQGPPVSDV